MDHRKGSEARKKACFETELSNEIVCVVVQTWWRQDSARRVCVIGPKTLKTLREVRFWVRTFPSPPHLPHLTGPLPHTSSPPAPSDMTLHTLPCLPPPPPPLSLPSLPSPIPTNLGRKKKTWADKWKRTLDRHLSATQFRFLILFSTLHTILVKRRTLDRTCVL